MQILSYQGVLLPYQVLRLVRVRVRETLYRAGVAAEEAVEVGANLVALGSLEVMALCAASLEEVGALLGVTCGHTSVSSSLKYSGDRALSNVAVEVSRLDSKWFSTSPLPIHA